MGVSVVGEAAVRINPETSGFARNAEQGILGPLGGIARAGAGLFAAAFAGGAIVHGITSFYDAAEESAKIGRLTNQVIQSTGGAANLTADQVGNLVTAISNKTGVDDEAIQSGANLLLTFTNIRNAAGAGNDIFTQTTQIMTDMSAALGTDASGSAIQLGKALNDPIAGVSALTKVGVSFTDAQKDQIRTLVESGDTLGAQKIILAELSKEFGGAAEAASSPMDKLKVNLGNLQEAIGGALLPVAANLAGFLTTTVLPALYTLGDYAAQAYNIIFKGDFTGGPLSEDSGVVDTLFNLRDGFVQFKDSVVAFVQGDTFAAWVQIAKDAADRLWGAIQVLADVVWNYVIPAFITVAQAIGSAAEYFRQHQTAAEALGVAVGVVAALFVAAWAMGVAAAIAGAVTQVISWVAVAVGAQEAAAGTTRSVAQIVVGWVVAAATAVANAAIVVGGWLLMGAQALFAAAQMAAAWLIALGPIAIVIAVVIALVALIIANWDTVKRVTLEVFQAIWDFIQTVWDGIVSVVTTAVSFVWGLIQAYFNLYWTIISTVFNTIVAVITGAWGAITGAFSAALGFITGIVSGGIDGVLGFFTALPGRILSALSGLGSLLVGLGGDLIHGLVSGIGAAAGFVGDIGRNVVNAIIGFINSQAIDRINDLLEFSVMGVHIDPPDIPHIPTFHSGGVFTSGAGGEGLALLRDQERVITPEQRQIADNLLADLLGGDLAAAPSPAAAAAQGITVHEHVYTSPGEPVASVAARVTQGVVWNLSTGITRRVGATAETAWSGA